MKEKYTTWITKNVEDTFRTCAEVTTRMLAAFPELTRVRGHYKEIIGNVKHQHWWLTDPDGEIVDPTREQFTCRSPLDEYIPWIEGSPEPQGMCRWCGNLSWLAPDYCSESCLRKLDAEYNGPLKLILRDEEQDDYERHLLEEEQRRV